MILSFHGSKSKISVCHLVKIENLIEISSLTNSQNFIFLVGVDGHT